MDSLPRIDRRTALKWMFAATASLALTARPVHGQAAASSARGYGTDPDLLKNYQPGQLWPLTLTEAQRRTAAALCDVVIPADTESPSASSVGVVDFIDEWISAPYPDQAKDRPVVLSGLVWIDAEAERRFVRDFASSSEAQKAAICDDICGAAKAGPAFREPARFFSLFRNLTAGGFYTTPQGRKDLRYVGNMPLATFDGPPPEVLRQAGLA
ncbi:MAG: gluconate 2-dehydrogenase subunit 3 family protein [Verrucomicrobiota bacterium]